MVYHVQVTTVEWYTTVNCAAAAAHRPAAWPVKTLLRSYCAQHTDKEVKCRQPKHADISG